MKHRLLTIFAAFTFGLSVFVGVLAMPASASAASSVTIYNNIPDPEPGNVASLGYEATSTSEFGGAMQFDGTKRDNPTAAVLMSSWACENGHWSDGDCSTAEGATFTHPITLNVYEINPDNSPGSLVGSTTETFTMPYRPSADNANCSGGAWYDGATCYNGEAFTISFELDGVTLPDEAIVSVAYNTSRHGASPIGTDTACFATTEGCPYDSLNVGTNATPSVGVPLPNANDAYLDSTWTGAYCDGGAGGTGTFRLDAGC